MANDPKLNKDPIDPQPIDLDADDLTYDVNDVGEIETLFGGPVEIVDPICLHENVKHRRFTTFEFWQCADCGEEVPKPLQPVGFDSDIFST